MERKIDIPKFAMTEAQLGKIICWPPWFDPIPPWEWLDKAQQVALFNQRMKYYQQIQELNLRFQKEIIEIQQNYHNEISKMLG